MKKGVLIVALAASFIAMFPLSIRLADPFFTFPFHEDWNHAVLLIWPDHVEARWFKDAAEVSPRPRTASYAFNIAPDQETWVKEQLRRLPSPNGNASWTIHVKQLGPSRQEIQLDLIGDGITGLVYEAQADQIVPLCSRLAGPAGAFVILAANLALWGAGWLFLCWVIRPTNRSRHSPPTAVFDVVASAANYERTIFSAQWHTHLVIFI